MMFKRPKKLKGHFIAAPGGPVSAGHLCMRQRVAVFNPVFLALCHDPRLALQPRFDRERGIDLLHRQPVEQTAQAPEDRKSTRLNSSHVKSSYAVFCLKKKMSHGDQLL